MPVSEKSSENEVISATKWNNDLLKDPHAVADKRKRVQNMFAAIAPSYDLNNRLHSLWMDQHWRKKAVKLANLKATDRVVDVACGTGDLTLKFVRGIQRCFNHEMFRRIGKRELGEIPSRSLTEERQVFGVDFTFEMLPIARKKTPPGIGFTFRNKKLERLENSSEPKALDPELSLAIDEGDFYNGVSWVNGDAQLLPLANHFCDVLSIAFGIRNVQDPSKALSEFRRVLRPGGRLIILEFSLPTNPILRSLYNFYFRQVLPRTATLISGDKTGAYKYLPESVNTFIGREKMMEMMAAAGFEQIEQFPMTFGVCVCYRGVVPDGATAG